MNRAITTTSVVKDVSIVLESVSLMLRLMMVSSPFPAEFSQVFADAVEHDDGIVQRVADDGQKGRDNGQGEFLAEKTENTPTVMVTS
jgi:hypothetical protein